MMKPITPVERRIAVNPRPLADKVIGNLALFMTGFAFAMALCLLGH